MLDLLSLGARSSLSANKIRKGWGLEQVAFASVVLKTKPVVRKVVGKVILRCEK